MQLYEALADQLTDIVVNAVSAASDLLCILVQLFPGSGVFGRMLNGPVIYASSYSYLSTTCNFNLRFYLPVFAILQIVCIFIPL